MWSKTDQTIATSLSEKSITFAHDTLVIVDQSSGTRVSPESLSCAIKSLPDILQGLSAKLNRPADVIDATTLLPNILQALSDSNLKAKVRAADNEHEIETWKNSLNDQRIILHDREIDLDDYRDSLEDSKKRMMVYANRIRDDRAALDAELKTFRSDRNAMSIAMEHIKLEQKRLELQPLPTESEEMSDIEVEQEIIEQS